MDLIKFPRAVLDKLIEAAVSGAAPPKDIYAELHMVKTGTAELQAIKFFFF